MISRDFKNALSLIQALVRIFLVEINSRGKKVYPSIYSSQKVQETVVNNPFSDSFNKVRFQFCRKIIILLSMGAMSSFPGRTYGDVV